MRYIDPHHVDSPKDAVRDLMPVYDGGEEKMSVALLNFRGGDCVAMRWNGGTVENGQKPTPGNPQSRGLPTWFVVDKQFEGAILKTLLEKDLIGGGTIDRDKAEKSIHKAIKSRGEKAEADIPSDGLEDKIIAVIQRLKSEGKI